MNSARYKIVNELASLLKHLSTTSERDASAHAIMTPEFYGSQELLAEDGSRYLLQDGRFLVTDVLGAEDGGSVLSIQIDNPGSGYVVAPNVTIDPPKNRRQEAEAVAATFNKDGGIESTTIVHRGGVYSAYTDLFKLFRHTSFNSK